MLRDIGGASSGMPQESMELEEVSNSELDMMWQCCGSERIFSDYELFYSQLHSAES